MNSTSKNLTSFHNVSSNINVPRGPLDIWFAVSTGVSVIGAVSSLCLLAVVCTVVCTVRRNGGCGLLIAHLVLIEVTMLSVHIPLSQTIVYLTQIGLEFYVDCNLVHYLHLLCHYTGNWTAAFLAVNRLVAMVFPTHYKHFQSKKTLVCMILSSWIFAVEGALPMYYKKIGYYGRFFPLGLCSIRAYDETFAGIVAFDVYVPLALIEVCYIFILLRSGLFGSSGVHPASKSNRENRVAKRRLAVTKLLCLSPFWYAVCFSLLPTINAFLPRITQTDIVAFLWLRFTYMCGYVGSPVRKLVPDIF